MYEKHNVKPRHKSWRAFWRAGLALCSTLGGLPSARLVELGSGAISKGAESLYVNRGLVAARDTRNRSCHQLRTSPNQRGECHGRKRNLARCAASQERTNRTRITVLLVHYTSTRDGATVMSIQCVAIRRTRQSGRVRCASSWHCWWGFGDRREITRTPPSHPRDLRRERASTDPPIFGASRILRFSGTAPGPWIENCGVLACLPGPTLPSRRLCEYVVGLAKPRTEYAVARLLHRRCAAAYSYP